MKKLIPLSVPNFEGNERKYVDDAISHAWVSTGGQYVSDFEKRMADFLQVEEVVACQSGTSALHLSLVEAGVEPGDTVLVPSLTFIAAVNPVRYQFAKPVFMDCDESLCLDPEKLRTFCEKECTFDGQRLLHNGSHVKALIVVHIFGNLADMIRIEEIAGTYNIQVIEDATEALGSKYIEGPFEGKYAGTIGDFGAFSFNGNKIITTGGGGAVTARAPKKAKHIKYLSRQAKDDPQFYVHKEVGYNYRMTNLQAALGLAQLEKLADFIFRKQRNYERYCELFSDFQLAKMLGFREGTSSNKWFYSLEIDRKEVRGSLKDIVKILEARGVQTRTVWGLINKQVPYRENYAYHVERAPLYANCILNLPCSTQLTDLEITYVVSQIKKVLTDLSGI